VQGPDEGIQGAHLSQAAEVDMPEVRQDQDAEAEVEVDEVAPLSAYPTPRQHWTSW
jgi:hypothetical protein